MKRACAIQGPTPSFLRWAIEYQCPLRELHPLRLPETTFRQLRSLREVSLARSDHRIHSGFCWHPTAMNSPPEKALGFPVEEVLDLFGGESQINHCCGQCPANAVTPNRTAAWAGCYGSLATDLSVDFVRLLRGEYQTRPIPTVSDGNNLVKIAQTLIEAGKRTDFPGNPKIEHEGLSWFGLWCQSPLTTESLVWLEELFREVLEHCEEINSDLSVGLNPEPPETPDPSRPKDCASPVTSDLQQMIDGMRRAIEFKLPFHVDLVPAGFSDGVTWTIEPHCGRCRRSLDPADKQCPACGPAGSYQNEIKLKVLGIRPYLLVNQIVGLEETQELLTDYVQGNESHSPDC